MFTKPVSDDPVVAIIGGGMAGLICALNLAKRGVRSTVFDTVGRILILSFFLCVYHCPDFLGVLTQGLSVLSVMRVRELGW